jgi:metal-dependent amidase/aminoacylase/carboxypeptidase family protein
MKFERHMFDFHGRANLSGDPAENARHGALSAAADGADGLAVDRYRCLADTLQ